MPPSVPHPALKGAKALVVGVANDSSIAYGCAKAFRELGAESPSPTRARRRDPTSSRSRAS
jgi:enoyl-[acyl-carrier-protein] reductase (NADH)